MITLIFKLDFYKVLIIAICGISVFTCGNSKGLETKQSVINDSDEIIFLTYNMTKNDNENVTIELNSKKIVEGKLRDITQSNRQKSSDRDFILRQLDKSSNIILEKIVSDPLFKQIEYVNESKQLAIKTVNLKETTFTVRLPLQKQCTKITLSKLTNSQPLITTNIK